MRIEGAPPSSRAGSPPLGPRAARRSSERSARVGGARRAPGPRVLGVLLVMVGAGLAWLALRPDAARAVGNARQPADEAALVSAHAGGAGLPLRSEMRSEGASEDRAGSTEFDEPLVRPSELPARTPRKESEFRAEFLALARTRPGALEARAREVLEGEHANVEKVALLETLVELRSPESARWLAHAVRTQPDEPRPEARSVARHALALLGREAARDEAACTLLGALAFEPLALPPALRRGAASAYARHCPEDRLDALRRALLDEADELLVAGVLASLAEREPTPRVARLQLDHAPLPPAQAEE